MIRKAVPLLLALLLGAGAFYNLYLLAPERPFTGDEMTGVAESLDLSFARIAVRGPEFELNNAPLHYLLDRAVLVASAFAPHRGLDLAVYLRLLPMLWLGLLTAAAFLFFARELKAARTDTVLATFLAFALAIFLALKPFLMTYGLEDRPYSLWLLLSFLHLVLFLEQYRAPRHAVLKAYCAISTLLVLTAFVSVLQVFVASVIFHFQKKTKARAHWLLASVLSLAAAWYLFHVHRAVVSEGQPRAMLDVFLDITMVAFQPWTPSYHFRTPYSNWLTASAPAKAWCLFALLLPLVHWKRPALRPLLLFAYGLVLCLLPITLVLGLKGQGVSSSRYLLFLFPALFALYVVTLVTVAYGLAWMLSRAKVPLVPAQAVILTLLFAALAGQGLHRQWIDIKVGLHFDKGYLSKKFWGLEVPSACPRELGSLRTPKGGVDLFQLQKLCGAVALPK